MREDSLPRDDWILRLLHTALAYGDVAMFKRVNETFDSVSKYLVWCKAYY